jgi:hypothetical protein
MAQAVSRRSLTTEAWVRNLVSKCGTCGGKIGNWTCFLLILLFVPVNIIPPWLSVSPGGLTTGPLVTAVRRLRLTVST